VTLQPLRALVVLSLVASAATAGFAQTASKPPTETARVATIAPVRVQVVIARYQGDKRISSLPYTMSINAAAPGRGFGQIRIGADVPLSTSLTAAKDGGENLVTAPASVTYEQIGTQIDCRVSPTDDGRYLLELTVAEKSVYAEGEGPAVARPGRNPPFRSFRSNNTIVLKDGQSAEFAAAGDRLTGEVVRVEATLHVVK
jgi:hypothetical protein